MNPRLFLTIGPPGCGKTTNLVNKAGEAVEIWGRSSVMICSLTKAAAAEVRSRKLSIPPSMVGTLHSHCYRALGSPVIAESKIAEWNAHRPSWKLSRQNAAGYIKHGEASEIPDRKTTGDSLYSQYTIGRARSLPREEWGSKNAFTGRNNVHDFADAWEGWKQANDYLDFQDLIDQARLDCSKAPGNPNVVYLDESQDSSLSEARLLEHWSRYSHIVMVGDYDQAIYQWRGADPHAVSRMGILDRNRKVLEQSYRVPRAVRDYAIRWIRQIEDRDDVVYYPRDEPGEVRRLSPMIHFNAPSLLINDAEQYLGAGKRVMFMSACSYMLQPLLRELRIRGMPFFNPYRTTQGAWNPLGGKRGVSSVNRIEAFLSARRGRWNWQTLKRWVDVIDSGKVLKRGAKKRIEEMAEATEPEFVDSQSENAATVDDLQLADLFRDSQAAETALLQAWDGKLDWFGDHLMPSKASHFAYPLEVARKHGIESFREEPQILVGTAHSFKGGEADVVYVDPSLSPQAMKGWLNRTTGSEHRDAVIRQFYVAFTRARESLILCGRSGRNGVKWLDIPESGGSGDSGNS